MKTMMLGRSNLEVPKIGIGCMRLNSVSKSEAEAYLKKAIELGANYFDHADIYGNGECEEIFSSALDMTADKRESMIIQSKCGIQKGFYDSSKEHILSSVEGILRRLKTDFLDVLLLHRPDALVDPEEVADAFDHLYTQGKVRHFGVSNHNPMQIQLLERYIQQPLLVDQLQLSITNSHMMSSGLEVNMTTDGSIDRDGSILDYTRLHKMTIQAWSPFQYGFFKGVFLNNDDFPELNHKINAIALKYGVDSTTIAIAWILRHPAQIMPIIGTMNQHRLASCCNAVDVHLTRKEWYDIYLAADHILP